MRLGVSRLDFNVCLCKVRIWHFFVHGPMQFIHSGADAALTHSLQLLCCAFVAPLIGGLWLGMRTRVGVLPSMLMLTTWSLLMLWGRGTPAFYAEDIGRCQLSADLYVCGFALAQRVCTPAVYSSSWCFAIKVGVILYSAMAVPSFSVGLQSK